ncbi:protein shisa-8-like isoform X1 [Acipenser ruthenus]|uniref:protein shisa-8-like isoform X1 n=1 Tax=Acipenser ruthenus TaxID=7906 RepID=UPI0027422EAB|nr:protein shisa-8-like isoform X1 [Acipenser ruthenus]
MDSSFTAKIWTYLLVANLLSFWTLVTLTRNSKDLEMDLDVLSNQTLAPEYSEVTLATPGSSNDPTVMPLGSRCRGYYDVMGQWDPPFNCNLGVYLFCCGTCGYRFCCQYSPNRLDQTACSNYDTPNWANTGKPPTPANEIHEEQDKDKTNMIVYIICGVVAVMVLVGIFTRLGLEKVQGPQTDLNTTRALTDLLKQPGTVTVDQIGLERTVACVQVPMGGNGMTGVSERTMPNSVDHGHLNNANLGLMRAHNNLTTSISIPGSPFNRYTSLKAVETAGSQYYKHYPMAARAPQPKPLGLHPKDKPLLQAQDLHAPLAAALSPSPQPKSKVSKVTHPLTSNSAFKAWDTTHNHPHQQPRPQHQQQNRRQVFNHKRQFSIENLPELFNQPLGYGRPPMQPAKRQFSTNSKTEVTV